MSVTLTVNGVARAVDAPPATRLLDALRETLALTGTKEGCGEGECGACTVLLDGVPVNSCLVALGQCATAIGGDCRLHGLDIDGVFTPQRIGGVGQRARGLDIAKHGELALGRKHAVITCPRR